MAKYVNLDEIDEILSCFGCPESSAEYANLISEIDSVAPADVVEVVRCGKCAFWRNEKGKAHYCMNVAGLSHTNENGFCHHGRRANNG